MNKLLDSLRSAVRTVMRGVAKALNKVTFGKLHPNVVTLFGLVAYIPVCLYLIPRGDFVLAGVLIIVFGLTDAIDGQLATLQGRASDAGMFLDSVTDRVKEILIYIGLAMYFAGSYFDQSMITTSYFSVDVLPLIVTALGVSLLVTYTNAWGEVTLIKAKKASGDPNKILRGGLASYDVRITLLGFGLIFIGTVPLTSVLLLIIVLSTITALDRVRRVFRFLK